MHRLLLMGLLPILLGNTSKSKSDVWEVVGPCEYLEDTAEYQAILTLGLACKKEGYEFFAPIYSDRARCITDGSTGFPAAGFSVTIVGSCGVSHADTNKLVQEIRRKK